MRRFTDLTSILAITDEERAEILQKAEMGDPVACFKQAQIYRFLHNCDDYRASAYELLTVASEGGVADADAAIAIMLFKGEIEPYDPVAAANLLEKALQSGSELAADYHLNNIIYGRWGCKQDVELAMKIVDGLIAESDNPQWYRLKGEILSNSNRNKEAVEWYERAVEAGLADAYDGLAYAKSTDDESDTRDYQLFMDIVKEGDEAGNPMCLYYAALLNMVNYDYIEFESDEMRDKFRRSIIEGFELCAEESLSIAFDTLGDIYYEGKMDIPVDGLKAWGYYVKGSEYMNPTCFERMYQMLLNDEIELHNMEREEAMDLCIINGARLRNRTLLIAAVEAYKRGRLTRYAREMEMFHLPAYDALPEDEPIDDEDDEVADDDGRFDAWA